jgi:XTP/dITP diphosphohydrolase
VDGGISNEPKGEHGFGYDPIFVPQGESRTFAEMEVEEKNQYSHRAQALSKLAEFLGK